MKALFLIFLLFLSTITNSQRILSYTHYNAPCQLLIRSDSTTIRIQQSKDKSFYIESSGRIKKIGNSSYQIVDTVHFSMSIMENDTNVYSQFGVYVDSAFKYFKDIKSLSIKYYDGVTKILKPMQGKYVNYYFDKSKFNKQHSYITIDTKHINPITNKSTFLKLSLRSSIEFSSKYIEKFQLFISSSIIHTMGEPIFGEINSANAN